MSATSERRIASLADGKILWRIADGIATLTFNNIEKHNAMSLDMWEALGVAMRELGDDPDVRVVILTGAGDKAFVSGADISQFEKSRHNAQASEDYVMRSSMARALLGNCPKPTIASIHGFCLGGGLQIAMLADIRIASESSQFGIPAAKLGVAYGYEGLRHLVSLVGPSQARLIMFTGMRIHSSDALKIGLIDQAAADSDLQIRTLELAKTIANNAPLAVAAAKVTIAEILKDPSERDMEAVNRIGVRCADSDDFREGRRAFMEKRKPVFHGC
jgi:enoyl-CoA hydratase